MSCILFFFFLIFIPILFSCTINKKTETNIKWGLVVSVTLRLAVRCTANYIIELFRQHSDVSTLNQYVLPQYNIPGSNSTWLVERNEKSEDKITVSPTTIAITTQHSYFTPRRRIRARGSRSKQGATSFHSLKHSAQVHHPQHTAHHKTTNPSTFHHTILAKSKSKMESKLKAKQEEGEGQKLGIASWSWRSRLTRWTRRRSTRSVDQATRGATSNTARPPSHLITGWPLFSLASWSARYT